MPLRVVLIGGVVALLAGIAIVLSQSGHELTGTNGAKREQFVAVLHGGQRACQPNATVPAGTGRLGLEIGTYGRPGPPLVVSVGRVSAALKAGWHEGTIAVPFSPAISRAVTGTLCVRNAVTPAPHQRPGQDSCVASCTCSRPAGGKRRLHSRTPGGLLRGRMACARPCCRLTPVLVRYGVFTLLERGVPDHHPVQALTGLGPAKLP